MTRIFGYTITSTMIALALTAGATAIATSPLMDRAYAVGRSTPAAVDVEPGVHSARRCSISTIAGEWAFRTTGKTPDGVDLAGVGTYHLGNDGKSSAHGWTNVGGVSFSEGSLTGTATVDADCTGTQVWEGVPAPAKVVILRNGREIWAVYDAPLFLTVALKRIDEPL
jgi:hypothetical protein